MEDTLKSIFDLETNMIMKYLTIFSAFMLPLTLITSFFGMNIEQGHFNNGLITLTIILTLILCSIVFFIYLFPKK